MAFGRWVYLFLMALTFLGFQNCGENVQFDSNSSKTVAVSPNDDGQSEGLGQSDSNTESNIDSNDNNIGNGNGNGNGNTNNGNPMGGNQGNSIPTPPIVVINNPLPPAPIVTGNVIYNGNVSFTSCMSYQELIFTGDRVQLPAKSANNVCYYFKIFNAISNHSSGSRGEQREPEVLSSNHNGDHGSYISPFIMGDRSIAINNSDSWKMSLSGAFNDPKVKMAIDNYFLVHLKAGGSNATEVVGAFGTADAEPGDGKLPILYKDLEVDFKAFAPGGTALVEAIGLQTPMLPADFNGDYDLRVRALDCGGSAELRDVYMVFH